MLSPYFLLLVLAVLTAAVAFWAAIEQQIKTRELLSQVTGGESLVYLEPLRKGGQVQYFVRHSGDHPSDRAIVPHPFQ
jgi:hypothetical protein